MVQTRSSAMSKIPSDIKEYFTSLVQPLVTQEAINTMFIKFKEEILSKLEQRILEQDQRIKKLESTLAVREKIIENLVINCDNNEQYSRRSCLRINGMQVQESENSNEVLSKVKSCYEEVGVDFNESCIDRAHRVGKSYDVNGVRYQSIIVKFRSWNDRAKLYRARPKFKPDHMKNSDTLGFNVAVDLTKRRYELLRSARETIKDNSKVKFAYADINCSLALCLHDNSFCYFNSEDDLKQILSKM